MFMSKGMSWRHMQNFLLKNFSSERYLRKHQRGILLGISEYLLNEKGQTPSAELAVECPFTPNSGLAARMQSLPGGCSLPCNK